MSDLRLNPTFLPQNISLQIRLKINKNQVRMLINIILANSPINLLNGNPPLRYNQSFERCNRGYCLDFSTFLVHFLVFLEAYGYA